MRIKLTLRPSHGKATIPINYQYPLSAAIYKVLQRASPAYSKFLHDEGYRTDSGRLMKLFTFSRLWIPDVRRDRDTLRGFGKPWTLQIGSPMQETFVQNFILGLFESTELAIGGQGLHAVFEIESVEALAEPEYSRSMRWKCLSPITASTRRETNGRSRIHYYRPDEPELSEALRANLIQKHRLVHEQEPKDVTLHFRIEAHDKPRSKLITIKEGTPEETQHKAFESYFTLEGSVELMRTAWECGLGEENSQGFGMVAVVDGN